LNADEEAIYKIMFTPQTDIPIGGIIEITFPEKNYKNIPRSPDCRLFGGISTFQTCQLNGNTYIVETA
jgi:histone deacetylase 6